MTIELYIKRKNLWYYVADKVSEPLNPLIKHGYHASNLGIIRQMLKNDFSLQISKTPPCLCQKLPPNYVLVGPTMLAVCLTFYVVQPVALNSTYCNLRNLE